MITQKKEERQREGIKEEIVKQRKESIKEGMKKETKELGNELKIVVLLHFLIFCAYITTEGNTKSGHCHTLYRPWAEIRNPPPPPWVFS